MRLHQVVPCALFAAFGSTLFAQAPKSSAASYRARVLGVFDASTGEPVEGAQVLDIASGTWAMSTKTGTVSLAFLPDGGATVRVRKIGYVPQTQFVAISPSDTQPVTLAFVPTATVLPTVVTKDSAPHWISPGLREFEARRKAGFGHFIAEAQLRKNDSREMSDLLRAVPGVTISCGNRTPRSCTAGSVTGGCMTLYWNGVRVTDRNLLMYNVNEFGGIEVYAHASEVPALYNATSSCAGGVILFWTRER